MHCCHLILMKIVNLVPLGMSPFMAKMHQICFPLGSLQRSPNSLTVFKGPTSKGKGEGGGMGKWEECTAKGEEREHEVGGIFDPPKNFGVAPHPFYDKPIFS